MTGAGSRRKGARGQGEFANLLRERDYDVTQITAGVLAEDLLARKDGKAWAVECKKTKTWHPGHLKQAKVQAKTRKVRWMLAWSVPGTRSWLVWAQGERVVLWHQGAE